MKFRCEFLIEQNRMFLTCPGEIGYYAEVHTPNPNDIQKGYDKDDVVIDFYEENTKLSFNDINVIQDNWNQMQEIRRERGLK